MRILITALVALLAMQTNSSMAVTVLSDSFDDSFQYSTLTTVFSDGATDYFGRVVLPTTPLPLPTGSIQIDNAPPNPTVAYEAFGTGAFVGGNYFGAQNTDEDDTTFSIAVMEWTGLNVVGLTDLQFSGLFAEDDAEDGNEDWDFNSSVRILARFDGGTYETILAFESQGIDTVAAEDTNLDGTGDGTVLTQRFQQFAKPIPGTGSSLDIRILIEGLNETDEDIAYQFINVTGTPVPEPSGLALFAAGLLGMGYRRQKTGVGFS
jgi:hypothetical protein